jgi:carboxylesterase type B
MLKSLSLLGLALLVSTAPTSNDPLTVRASTGVYKGVLNETYPNVRAFLSIPYGQTTAGENRWMPPKAVPFSNKEVDTTQYPPACPQYVTGNKNIWNQEIPWYLQYWGVKNYAAGVSAPFASEDCLKLAVWTPVNVTSASRLPVAMFWTGGGFQTNGILVPGQLPPGWVSRSQKHVVVTINYRMNIMGFPNAAGLSDQNLGLLDCRLALEWVRDNIAHFGGDPSRIMIWGQSVSLLSIAPICSTNHHPGRRIGGRLPQLRLLQGAHRARHLRPIRQRNWQATARHRR